MFKEINNNKNLENIWYTHPETEEYLEERWADITNYENIYQISDLGRVKALKRELFTQRGTQFFKVIRKEKILNPHLEKGYLSVYFKVNNQGKSFKPHRLVALHFIPNPENKPEVNHKKGIKTDNRWFMLEWNTSRENVIHAHTNGLTNPSKGEKQYKSKFKNSEIFIIKNRLKEGEDYKKLAVEYKVAAATIYDIKNNRKWKHIII